MTVAEPLVERGHSIASRSKTEHIACVSKVIWADEDSQRIILKLNDNTSAIGPGTREQFLLYQQQYRFLGRWSRTKFGDQFEYDTFVAQSPHTQEGVVKYLTEICSGVGRATAKKLWDAYGPDACRTLREQPEQVAEDGLMKIEPASEASKDLQRNSHLEGTRVDLFGLLSGRGFGGKIIDKLISKFGAMAPQIVARDPFSMLVNRVPGCGFRKCDKLYLDMGHDPLSLKRQALAGWNAFREDRTGSTWLAAEDCVEQIVKLIPGAEDPIAALRLLIRAGWLRVRREGDDRWLAVTDRADAELSVATSVERLRRGSNLWPRELPTSQADGDGLPSVHQVEQLLAATTTPIGCFIGPPGSGKTFSLAHLLRAVIRDYGRDSVAVVAPTGKASVRAGESLRALGLDLRAQTIHQFLEIGRNGHDGDGWGFTRNRHRPVNQRFIVVDEVSMVDTSLMADLLQACAIGTHVLLVGDPYQLPPVGHGAPLRDLLAGGITFGELTEIRRNSGLIVEACSDIKAGREIHPALQLELDAANPVNLGIVECGQAAVAGMIQELLGKMTRFNVWTSQIITGLNDRSDTSRKELNDKLGKVLNPDGVGAANCPFRVGDKIICRRNSRLKIAVPNLIRSQSAPHDSESYQAGYWRADPNAADIKEWYVANGEIGRVVAVSPKCCIVRFAIGDDSLPLVFVPNPKRKNESSDDGVDSDTGELVADKEQFQLAWAITVHSSQGSEWPLVICAIDDAASMVADRNYWYTAISRARKCCLLVGQKGVFDKQIRRMAIDNRKTFLADLLKEGAS
jgi:exodeoxyribonuclease V alpha subunit